MRLFETASIAFGGGSRVCLGRNLSQMELYKVWADADCEIRYGAGGSEEKW